MVWKRVTFFLGLLALLALTTEASPLERRTLNINIPNLFPEGLAFWPPKHFLVSSIREGTIYRAALTNDTSRPKVFPWVFAPDVLVSTLGIQIDIQRSLVYIVNIDPARIAARSSTGASSLVVADLETGNVRNNIDLSSIPNTNTPHWANDLAFDTDGTVYVTDSLTPQIWAVNPTTGAASVYVSSSVFSVPGAGQFGLNGIEINRTGRYLLVGESFTGNFYRVSLNADASQRTVTRVSFTGLTPSVLGADGIRFLPDGRLVVVTQQLPLRYFVLSTRNGWQSVYRALQLAIPNFDGPTAVAVNSAGKPYILNSHIGGAFNNANTSNFEIKRVYVPPAF